MRDYIKMKNSQFKKFADSDSAKNEKYLGDVWLTYEDMFDAMPNKIRYIMFGAVMGKNYINLTLNEYQEFAKYMGATILNFKATEALAKLQNSPEIQKAIKDQIQAQQEAETPAEPAQLYR